MNRLLKKILAPIVVTTFALALPLSVQIQTTDAGASGVVLRVNDACGQATECAQRMGKICSTHNSDWKDYECTKGCGIEPI